MLRSAELWIRVYCQTSPSCSLTVREPHLKKPCLPNPHLAGNDFAKLSDMPIFGHCMGFVDVLT